LVSNDSFLAIKRVLGKLFQKRFANQLLRLDVDREFDVVRGESVDVLRAMEVFPKHYAGGSGCILGGIEIMLHVEVEAFSR
jgi:hypothetical protein